MNVVYDAVCPLIAGWALDALGAGGEAGNAWYLKGGGMILSHPKEKVPSAAMVSAASIPGGKSVNQDACGWRTAAKPGGGFVRVAAVADGVSGSLYSEFGAILATIAALRAGAIWGGKGDRLEDVVLQSLTECQSQMERVAHRIRSELERVVDMGSSRIGVKGVEEARRHLDIFNQEGAEPLCTTVLVVAIHEAHVAGLVIGNGGVFQRRGAAMEPLWWRVDSEDLHEYVGVGTTPQKASFCFEDTWHGVESGVVGLATDGVGSFERFKQVYLRRASWPSGDLVLEEVLSDMTRRGVALDLVDNLALAEAVVESTDERRRGSHAS